MTTEYDTQVLTFDELKELLWDAADILRGTVDASDFKLHILGLLTYKRLSDVFEDQRQHIIQDWVAQGQTREQAEKIADDPDEYPVGRYFIPKGAHWNDVMAVAENRAEAIDVALHAIEEKNDSMPDGVLTGVRFNDPRKFGDPVTMDALMQRLLVHFSHIPLHDHNLAEPDVLGDAYQYLIERFAEDAGKKGGEFYTPRMVVRLITEILQPAEGMRIHDPTCGSGGMLIEAADFIKNRGGDANNVTLTGQEKNHGTWALAVLNMLLHHYPDADIRPGDTINNPRFTDAGALVAFDRVIANPPFSLKEWHGLTPPPDTRTPANKQTKGGKKKTKPKVTSKQVDEHFKNDPYHRFKRGVPPATKGDMAFLSHMVNVCKDKAEGGGMIGVVMPHGVLFRGGSEAKIRKALLEEDLIEAVIGLPGQLFYGAGIAATVIILNTDKPADRRNKVLFIDASSPGMYRDGKARNYLRLEDILRIVATYRAYPDLVSASTTLDRVHAEIDRVASEWNQGVRRHEEAQLERVANQPQDLKNRIIQKASDQKVAIQEATHHTHAWLDALGPDGEPANRPENARPPLEKFAAVVSLDEIANDNKYNLNISRYVDPTDPPPQLDVKQELAKLRELEQQRDQAEKEMDRLLAELGYAV